MQLWLTPRPAVKAAIDILSTAFGSYAVVSSELPRTNPPDRFVKVTRVGGGQPDPTTDHARILVECFGRDTETVENMCNTARAGLRNSAGTMVVDNIFIRGWDNEDGPADLPHPDMVGYSRWQFHGSLLVKANDNG